MIMPVSIPRYTAEEVRHFPDDRLRYEVIRGELFVTPAPGTPHQRIIVSLIVQLHEYVERHGLGEVIVSPFEVEFSEDTAVQPDVIVFLSDRASQLTRKRLQGPQSLAVEVVSYSSKRTDRLQKRGLYLEEGVTEYWVVDPDLRRVERWRLGDEAPEVLSDSLEWRPAGAPPFVLELLSLFERAHR